MLSLVTYLDTDINNCSDVLIFVKKKVTVLFFWLTQTLITKVIGIIIYKCTLMTFANLKHITIKTISNNKENKYFKILGTNTTPQKLHFKSSSPESTYRIIK